MKNPIPKSKLFATPATEQDLYNRLEQLTGKEKALAFQIAMMTFNLCNHLVNKEIACQELIDPLDA